MKPLKTATIAIFLLALTFATEAQAQFLFSPSNATTQQFTFGPVVQPQPVFQLQPVRFVFAQQLVLGQFNRIRTGLDLDILDGNMTNVFFDGQPTGLYVRHGTKRALVPTSMVVLYDHDGPGPGGEIVIPVVSFQRLPDNDTLLTIDWIPAFGSTLRVTARDPFGGFHESPRELARPQTRGFTSLNSPRSGIRVAFPTTYFWSPAWTMNPKRQLLMIFRGQPTINPTPGTLIRIVDLPPGASIHTETSSKRIPTGEGWWTVWPSDGHVHETPIISAETYFKIS